MIILTEEQTQQIEEVLLDWKENFPNHWDSSDKQALSIIRAARAQEQAEQEPEVWYCPDCGTLSETQVKCCPDWIRSRKVPKNFAFTCKATFDRNVQAEQEQVAVLDITYGREPECYATPNADDLPEGTYRLYAAPVRTKDLTDDEIWKELTAIQASSIKRSWLSFARAVIAADRAKNNLCERTKWGEKNK